MEARPLTHAEPGSELRRLAVDAVRELHPAYFAMVMATGIVSIVSHVLGLREASEILLVVNVPAYVALWGVLLARAVAFRRRLVADLASHQRGPGFFTVVAATNVLGLQLLLLRGETAAALWLWGLGVALWIACTYTVFVLLSVRETKPSLAEGINGGWLVAVVATQSVCVLGTRVLAARLQGGDQVAAFALLSLWLCGGMLYVWMISLIFYRYMFFRFSPADLMPPYWINMGAVAISVVAGTSLAAAAPGSPLLTSVLPFVNGLTLMFWATATWWIPMLVVLGVWRHRVARFPVAYDPLYWGLVFPLGMYGLCTYRVGEVFALPFLRWIAWAFAATALSAWLLTFFGWSGRALHLALLGARALHRSRVRTQPRTGPLENLARRS